MCADLPMIIEEITFFDMVPHRKIIVEVDGPGVANNTVAHTIIKLMMGRGPVQNHSPEELGKSYHILNHDAVLSSVSLHLIHSRSALRYTLRRQILCDDLLEESLTYGLGITGDPTHEQYGFESGVDDFRSYVQGKTNNTPRAYIRRAFGYQYQCHLGHMERGDVTAFIVEAAARTTQKTVYNVLKEIGIGIRDLLVMAEHDFSREEDKILHVLERDLAALQREMGLRWDYPEYDHLDYVRYRVKECDGEGYNVCADAMRRLGVV
jgi:hypothetical protein